MCERANSVDPADLLWLVERCVKVSKATASGEFPEDLAEQFLRVDVGGLAAPVLLLSPPSLPRPPVEARRPVRVVLFPLHLVTQNLWEGEGGWEGAGGGGLNVNV